MKLLFTSTVIILFSSFLGISASAEGHKITGQTIITKEQFLSLIDGQADNRLTKKIKALNDRIEELASAETFIRKQNDDLMNALEILTNELAHLRDEKTANQLNNADYQKMVAEEIQILNNKVDELSSSETLVRRQNKTVMAELATTKSELSRLESKQSESQTTNGNESYSGEISNDYKIPEALIDSSTNNSELKRSFENNFKGLVAYIGVNHSSSTTSYKWSSGGDNLELDGVGRQSINASFGLEYNLGLGRTTRLLLGFEFNPTSEDFVEITGTQSGNPGDFKAILKNRQSYYAGLGFVPSGNTMIYGKLSYDQGDAELKTNPVLQNQNVQFKGFGYGAGLRTLLSKNIFLGTEVMRINYEKESVLGVNTGTGTTNGKVQLGAFF
ncbi:hypothetical protein OAT45_00615 [Alphaproteobacteria bacterium]|nr:hypothetical protein [Alphaproteobacteria bacterium]